MTGRLWVSERHAEALRALLTARDELDEESRAVLGGQQAFDLAPAIANEARTN